MLPEHIQNILNKWQTLSDSDAKVDIAALCEEISNLELAWRLAEEQLLYDTQTVVRLKHLLRRLRYTMQPDAEAPANEHQAYELMLSAVDKELARRD